MRENNNVIGPMEFGTRQNRFTPLLQSELYMDSAVKDYKMKERDQITGANRDLALRIPLLGYDVPHALDMKQFHECMASLVEKVYEGEIILDLSASMCLL